MKEVDCINRIQDLKFLLKIYTRLINDKYSTFFNDTNLRELIYKTKHEIFRLDELIKNMELVDSYDQNTGLKTNNNLQ